MNICVLDPTLSFLSFCKKAEAPMEGDLCGNATPW